ncbi:MAG: cellulase family glycosylhydrolase [Thermoleophilia bacterium]|nr:cellulase family glycosylhydrolase [Thermoleophilia bacterium]
MSDLEEKKYYRREWIAISHSNLRVSVGAIFIAVLMSIILASCGNDGASSGAATPPSSGVGTVMGQTTGQSGTTVVEPQEIGMNVGDNFALISDKALDEAMADMSALGLTWIRFDMSWDLIQPQENNQYTWSRYDRIVAAASRHGIKSLPILTYTPQWARLQACKENFQCAPADPAKFATFTGEAAKHYKPMGIDTWEIWNEPNIDAFWKPDPDAVAYVDLLKGAYKQIKQVDPNATVISGGLSPAENVEGRVAPIDYLKSMYQNGARDYFDALGYHPFSYPALPSEVLSWSNWSQMSDLNPSIRSTMVANGDSDKKIWATEYGVPTDGLDSVNETLQALSYRDVFPQIADKPWLATLFFHTYKDYGNDPYAVNNYFGIIRKDGTRKPAYDVLKGIMAAREKPAP